MNFVNLHQRSHYSLLNGFGSPEQVVLRAKELGYPAVALTDNGVLYGAIEFYKTAKKHDVRPIIGCHMYMAARTRFDKEPKVDTKRYHLTLLAENNEGYENLMQLVTKANLEGFYYKPRADYGLLKAYSKGIIALSGGITGHIGQTILKGDLDEVRDLIKRHQEIFGDENFFLELQDHPLITEQAEINAVKKNLAKELNIPLVVTTDSHYPTLDDSEAHDILLCMQSQASVADERRFRLAGDFSMRPVEELKKIFADVPEALQNTVKISERCNVDITFGEHLLPKFTTPNGIDSKDYLIELCNAGLLERYGDAPSKEAHDRLAYELEIVNKMGFADYFLIVWDFIRFAKEQGIVVGPGRGSAAGAIIAYCLKITELDPLKYGLLFERFLNPERIGMPDIDIDFADLRRDEVLDYVVEKYGRENVAQIITFGTMAAKAAVRDVGRSLGYPYGEVDAIAKLVPPTVLGKHAPLAESVENDPDFGAEYKNNPRAKTLIDLAIKLEGTVRHAGTHACAVVIAEKPLVQYTPLQKPTGDNEGLVTQYSMKPIEDIGLLKMDFLGLKNLTVIEQTIVTIKRTKGLDLDISKIPLDDKKTFKLLQEGRTTGVFQLESAGMRRYLKELKPTMFEDIIAMGALYRPGPMDWIPMYIKGKHNPKKVKYLHQSFESILNETYGVAVYQEQILQIAREFAGFSFGEADILRRAVGKKIPALLKEQHVKFVKMAVENGHKDSFAEEVFEKVILPFAGYGFNKSHAACYGLISYQTAYLKANYPAEYMSALLSADFGNTDKVVLEIEDCEEMGIEILPPDINESFGGFTVIDDKTLRFGLTAIKGVGEGPIREIMAIRNEGDHFSSLEDFAKRSPSKLINKKMIQALAYSGALDRFGLDRHLIAENYEGISKFSKHVQASAANGQTDIFGALLDQGVETANSELHLSEVQGLTKLEILQKEKELLGMYVSSHPLRGLTAYLRKKAHLIAELGKSQVSKKIKVCGLVVSTKKILTRSGQYMMYLQVEDTSAKIDVTVFPRQYQKFADLLADGNMVKLEGKLEHRRGQLQLLLEGVSKVSLDTVMKNAQEAGLYDPEEKIVRRVKSLDEEEEEEIFSDDGSSGTESEQGESPLVIDLPASVDVNKLKAIKGLLLRHKGATEVEIHLKDGSRLKRIKVPFGVNFNQELQSELEQIVS